jgi:hypothetical protein
MVLIGLINIAVVLMALLVLGVPGVQWKLVPTASRASRTTICCRPARD